METNQGEVRRTESIKIRLTPAEHQKLNEIKARPELARWMREHALNVGSSRKHVIKHELPIDVVRALAGIGNNLNQMAKLLHQEAQNSDLDIKRESLAIMLQLQATEQALNDLRERLKDDRSVF